MTKASDTALGADTQWPLVFTSPGTSVGTILPLVQCGAQPGGGGDNLLCSEPCSTQGAQAAPSGTGTFLEVSHAADWGQPPGPPLLSWLQAAHCLLPRSSGKELVSQNLGTRKNISHHPNPHLPSPQSAEEETESTKVNTVTRVQPVTTCPEQNK